MVGWWVGDIYYYFLSTIWCYRVKIVCHANAPREVHPLLFDSTNLSGELGNDVV